MMNNAKNKKVAIPRTPQLRFIIFDKLQCQQNTSNISVHHLISCCTELSLGWYLIKHNLGWCPTKRSLRLR